MKNKLLWMTLSLLMVGFFAQAQYCAAGPTSTADSNVQQVDITGDTTSISHTGCSPAVTGLDDLTAQSVDLTAGTTYNLDVTFGTCGGNYDGSGEVWIDLNQNEIFEATESFGTSSGEPGTAPWDAPVSFSINIPVSAINGATRMRIMQQEGNGLALPLDPCGTYSWGSVMDFTINISGATPPPACQPAESLAVVPQDVTADLSWSMPATGDPVNMYNWEIVPQGNMQGVGVVASGMVPGLMASATGLTQETPYTLYVSSTCASGSSIFASTDFSTTCSAISSPYLEDFSTFTTSTAAFVAENCWTATGGSYFWESAPGTDTSSTGTGPSPTITTGNYFFTEASSGNAGDITDLVSPLVDLSSLTTPALLFDYHMFGNEIGTLDILVNGTDNVFSITGEQQTSDTEVFAQAQVDLSAYAGQTIFITMRATSAGTFEGDIAIDNVQFDELPSCLIPINLTEVASSTTTIDINLDSQNGNSLGRFQYIVQAPGAGTPTGATMPTGSFAPQAPGVNYTLQVPGLTPATTYEIYIREQCTAIDVSDWTGPVVATTDCIAISDFSENFDGVATPNLPVCWSSFSTTPVGTTLSTVTTSTAADSSVPNGVRLYSGSLTGNIGSGTSDEGENILISPLLSNLADATHRIVFSADAGTASSTVEVGTMTDPSDPSTFSLVQAIAPTTTHALYFVEIPSTTDQYVAFRHIFVSTFDNMYLDDISWEAIPACEPPINEAIAAFDDTNATVTWTNNASNSMVSSIEYGVAGFTPGTGTTVAGGADTVTIMGLTPETSYDVYIQQDCNASGDGLSPQVGPVSFTTFPAGPAGITCNTGSDTSIFTEDFSAQGGWTGDIGTGSQVWRFAETGGTGSGNTGPSDAQDAGGSYAYFEASSNTNSLTTVSMVSPVIDLSSATDDAEVTFWMHAYGATIGTLNVRLSATTDFTASPIAFTTTGQLQLDELDPWNQIGVNAGAFIGGDLYVQFEYSYDGTDFTSDFAIDELAVNACVTSLCSDSSSINVDSVDSTSITVSWTDNSVPAPASWEVVAVPAGDPIPAAGTPNVTTNPYTVTGLMPNTSYDVYVRPDCTTAFVPFVNGTTDCPPSFSAPYFTDFEGFTATLAFDSENCWIDLSATIFDWAIDTAGGTGSSGTGPSGAFSGSTFLFIEASNGANGDVAIINSPGVDLSGLTNPVVSFYYHMNGLDGINDFDINVSSDGGTTFTNEMTISGQQQSSNDDNWAKMVIDLSAYAGQNVIIQLSHTKNVSSVADGTSSFEGDISIDDFFVGELDTNDFVWNGSAWLGGQAPEGAATSTSTIIVDAGAAASLTAAVDADDVFIVPGGSLDLSAGDITVAGNLANNGAITGTSQVNMSGTDSRVISGTGSFTNLNLNNSGGVVVLGEQDVLGILSIADGDLDVTTNGTILTFKSNASDTAALGVVSATGSVTGDVNVERYIPASNRSYRFLGSSVTGPTVFDSWQEGAVNAAGFGIQVTGVVGTVGVNNVATGLDETTNGSPSMFSWDEAGQSWTTIGNTTSEVLNAGDFYRVFVRGDRLTDLSTNTPTATETTLRATGSLLTGNYTVSPVATSGQFFAVANPYQSKLDMGAVAPSNVAADMYYWDPSLGTNGGYTSINIASGTGTAGSATNVLDAGQAVFFSSTGSSSVVIDEADKVGGTANAAVFSAPVVNQLLRVKLYQTSRYQNNQSESDGMYIHFDNTFNDAVTFNDAIKWDGLNTNISVEKSTGEKLSVERRSLPTINESVPLHLSNHIASNYTLTVELDALPGLDVFVKDNMTNTLTPVASNGITAVSFTVDSNDAASIDANRFELVFQIVTLGLGDEDLLSQVNLYPNPVVGDELQLNLGNLNDGSDLSVSIYNTLGQKVRDYSYESNVSNTISVSGLSTLSTGVYILNITKGGKTATHRFIKK